MDVKQWHWEKLGQRAADALNKNNFKAEYVPTAAAAVERLLEVIPAQGSVGVGGSVTISELGILDKLAARGNQVLYHHTPGLTPEQSKAIRKQQQICDCFICSTNAITLDGKLVNIDGNGNRVSAMIFGPERVVIVAGGNKIVKDVDAALDKIEMTIAPLNNKRLNTPNPCSTTGICMDCQSPNRICNVVTVMRRRPRMTDMTVLIVGEELGY